MSRVRRVPGYTDASPLSGIIRLIRVPEGGDTSQVENQSLNVRSSRFCKRR